MKATLSDKELPKSLPTELADIDNVQPGYLGTSPPQSQPPARGERIWIERPEQLQQAVKVLEQAKVVAVDAEFTQARSRTAGQQASSGPRLALLQLAIDGKCFVVDALRLNDLSPLKSVVENPETIILLHGAGADLRVMAERGLNVAHYYDLEATSRSIFGQQESSLAAMLHRALNVRLDKSLQRTDWTRRPLPPAMIAYAARDAEMTLALYYWLVQHYPASLKLHEHTDEQETVAAWIEPFLHGTSPASAEVVVAEAKARGKLSDEQIYADSRSALATLVSPMLRSRLLRLIADLSLVELAPDLLPLLQASTAEERAGAVRALGRLGYKQAKEAITPLLKDPVYDVRKAAQASLSNLSNSKEPRKQKAMPTKLSDGSRRWVVGASEDEASSAEDNDWKAQLRAMLGE
jgi:3'-5' exonuclease/HEAT repeats